MSKPSLTIYELTLLGFLDTSFKCAALHHQTTVVCSNDPIWLLTHCTGEGLICSAAMKAELQQMRAGLKCSVCLRPAKDCWDVSPVGVTA